MYGAQEVGLAGSLSQQPPQQYLADQSQGMRNQYQQSMDWQGHTLDASESQRAVGPVKYGTADTKPPSYEYKSSY